MRRILIAGNWKMNLNVSQASLLVHRLQERIQIHRDVEVVLCPSMLHLQPLSVQLDRRKFRLGAQNAYYKDEGAYTGEVSFTMLRDLVHYVIVGHSERRHIFGETLDTVRDKVSAAVRNEITPILCVGETKTEKLAGETHQVLHDQVTTALSNVTSREVADLVVAYEPVWAINRGDGKDYEAAKPWDIEKAVATIRHNVASLYGEKAARNIRILYGGSTNPDNAHALLRVDGVDGLLLGGASLNYEHFTKIVEIASEVAHERTEAKD